MQSLRQNWLMVSNIWNFANFHSNTQKSKSFYFCPEYMRFELKKYREVIFHDTKQ